MIVKFFANRGAGSPKASIDYLRGKDCKRELATVLSGDPDLTQSIAEASEFKNRYTVGCLSFEERDLPMKSKREIMDKFEETIFSGLEKDQYSITWIEHRDKERLELNFFIANTELKTGKRLQPYYDKADRGLTDGFCKVINQEYRLSDPHDPSKKQLVKIDKTTPKDAKSFKKEITDFYIEKIQSGKITDRSQIIENIAQSGIEISRTTEKSISIKNPIDEKGRNIRLDGEIYSNEFYSDLENNKKGLPTQQDEYKKTKLESYEKAVILLEKLTHNRKLSNQGKYQIKGELEKVKNDNEQKRTLKEIRAELGQRAEERKRANRGDHQGIDGGIKTNSIHSNAECTEYDRESIESEVLERSNSWSYSDRNYSIVRLDDLLHMERPRGESEYQERYSDFEEDERELRGIERTGETRIDRNKQRRQWGVLHHEPIEESESLQERQLHGDHQHNGLIKGFYHELSGRVKNFIQRFKGRGGEARERATARDRGFREYSQEFKERERKVDESFRKSDGINRSLDERKRRIDENINFVKGIERSNARTEREIKRAIEPKRREKSRDLGMGR